MNQFDDDDIRFCNECDQPFPRSEMTFSQDCHGITFRLLCPDCYEKAMAKGYDGEEYDETDECIDDDCGFDYCGNW